MNDDIFKQEVKHDFLTWKTIFPLTENIKARNIFTYLQLKTEYLEKRFTLAKWELMEFDTGTVRWNIKSCNLQEVRLDDLMAFVENEKKKKKQTTDIEMISVKPTAY